MPAADLGLTNQTGVPSHRRLWRPVSIGPKQPIRERVGVWASTYTPGFRARRVTNARQWAWMIAAAATLLLLGIAIGSAIQSRGDRRQLATSNDRGQSATKAPREPSPAVEAPIARGRDPSHNAGEHPDDAERSTGSPAMSSPLRTTVDPSSTASGMGDAAAGKGEMDRVGGPDPTGQGPGSSSLPRSFGRSAVETRSDGPPGVLFQEVLIHRRPSFGVLMMSVTQDIQYAIMSRLNLQPRSADGSFRVIQEVLRTRLDRADAMSPVRMIQP